MSRDNAELFLESIEAFNRMDIPAVMRHLDPEVRFDHRLAELQGTYTGLEGVQGLFEDVAEHFSALKIDCPDVRDLGDRVLALGTARLTGKLSGAETELPFTVVASFSNGLMTHFTDYGDREQALEAAGLEE